MVVRKRVSEYDVTRSKLSQEARFGGSSESETRVIEGVKLWLHQPNEVNIDTEYGDRLGGDLQGLALPDADIDVHDRVTYLGEEYEVDRVFMIPNEDSPVVKQFSLQRKVN
jgi:hypothetical protein